jgi:V8-like Glu-specific endopeptidase
MTDPITSAFDLSEDELLAAVEAAVQTPADEAARPAPSAPAQRPPNTYELAAAVLACFDPGALKPIDGLPDEAAVQQLRLNSMVKVGAPGEAQWSMTRPARIDALRALREGKLVERALQANPRSKDDPIQQALDMLLTGSVPALDELGTVQLAALYEAGDWLAGAGFEGLPPANAVTAELRRKSLLEPFEEIAGDAIFRGRQNELQRLRDYVGVLPPQGLVSIAARVKERLLHQEEKPPLLIYGPGGVGKSTLVARFILEHAREPMERRFPFAYLDFDRPEVNENEPLSLLVESVRQLGLQFPEALEKADALQARWREEFARNKAHATSPTSVLADADVLPEGLERAAADFSVLTHTVGAADQPVVMVLDTIEELQFAVGARLNTIWPLLNRLREHTPRLRVVLAGRGEVEGRKVEPLALLGLDRLAAIAYLKARGVSNDDVAGRIADRLGGSPLSLKLAADLAHKTDWTGSDLPLRFLTFDSQLLQRQLYRRVLEHIHDPQVRSLAYPGLILRRITAELILEVLAEPCGLKVADLGQAEDLMDALGREMSLVYRDPDGSLRHRQDLRLLMLELIRSEDPRRFDDIQRRAVAFYAAWSGPTEKAEEIYHRLSLNQPREQIDPLWIPGVQPLLLGAADEFKGSRRAYLARRLGLKVDPETEQSADLEDWESLAARDVAELLSQNQHEAALQRMSARSDRSPASPLVPLQARALVLAERWDEALEVLARGFNTAALEGQRLFAFDLAVQSADIVLAQRRKKNAAETEVRLAGFDEELGLDRAIAALSRRLLLADLAEASPAVRGQLASRLIAAAQSAPEATLRGEGALGLWAAAAIVNVNRSEAARLLALAGMPAAPERELRRLASELADFDALLSAVPGAERGVLAREFGLGEETSLTQTWTRALLQARPEEVGRIVVGVLERPGPRPSEELLSAISKTLLASLGLYRAPRSKSRRTATLIPAAARQKQAYPPEVLDQLTKALLSAFSQAELGELVSRRIGLSVEAVSLGQSSERTVYDLVAAAAAQGWIVGLATAALEARPADPAIAQAAAALGVESLRLEPAQMPSSVSAGWLAVVQAQVCLVEADGQSRSTGFLIGRDLVLTSGVVIGEAGDESAELQARFDFRSGPGGAISQGTIFSARVVTRRAYDPEQNGFGYTLLQLNEPAGILPIGHLEGGSGSALRGWIALPDHDAPLQPKEPLVVIHHPEGRPLVASAGIVTGADPDDWTFSYRVDTGPGSGGAPCFNSALELVGLHLGKTEHLDGFGCRVSVIARDLAASGIFIGQAMA